MASIEDQQIKWLVEKLGPARSGIRSELAAYIGLRSDRISKIISRERKVSAPEWVKIGEFFNETPPGFGSFQRGEWRSEDVANALDKLPARRHDLTGPKIPLISFVSAGKYADPNVDIPTKTLHRAYVEDLGAGEFFATRVDGDSMDLVAPDRAIIIVNRKDQQLVDGRCYVFSLKGETTFKQYRHARGKTPLLMPRSVNKTHLPDPFVKRDMEVVGRVRRVISDL